MAKKKAAPWSMNVKTAASAAKKSIAETSKVVESKTTKLDLKTAKTGRPLDMEGEKVKVLIGIDARDWAKKIAVMEGDSMTKYLTNLVFADAKKKGYLKE